MVLPNSTYKDFAILRSPFLFLTLTSHTGGYYQTTYYLLCQRILSILQPLDSESCHQETIAIALPQLVFTVISRFCCL